LRASKEKFSYDVDKINKNIDLFIINFKPVINELFLNDNSQYVTSWEYKNSLSILILIEPKMESDWNRFIDFIIGEDSVTIVDSVYDLQIDEIKLDDINKFKSALFKLFNNGTPETKDGDIVTKFNTDTLVLESGNTEHYKIKVGEVELKER